MVACGPVSSRLPGCLLDLPEPFLGAFYFLDDLGRLFPPDRRGARYPGGVQRVAVLHHNLGLEFPAEMQEPPERRGADAGPEMGVRAHQDHAIRHLVMDTTGDAVEAAHPVNIGFGRTVRAV